MTPADTQAALDAATATLASGQCDEYSARHARDVLALVAEVSALRDEGHGPNPCGAHGCTLAPNDGGQRVNGGCRCSAAALRLAYLAMRKERDEARARIARYVAALDEVHASLNEPPPATHEAWEARDRRTSDAHHAADAALAALRETPAGEGER